MAGEPLARCCTGDLEILKRHVEGLYAQDLLFISQAEFLDQLGCVDRRTRPVLRALYRRARPAAEYAPPPEDRVFMSPDGWQIIDFSSMLLPKGTRGAATAAGGRVASTSLADLLTRLVKQGVVQPQHPTCLNLSKSRLGDDDVPFIAEGVRRLSGCPRLCIVLKLTRVSAPGVIETLLRQPNVEWLDISATPLASTGAVDAFETLSSNDAARLVMVSNPRLVAASLAALFRGREGAETLAELSTTAHEHYYLDVDPMLRERSWTRVLHDAAQARLAEAASSLANFSLKKEEERRKRRDGRLTVIEVTLLFAAVTLGAILGAAVRK